MQEKLTQEELAKQLHVSRQAVSSWERGISEPDLDMIQQMSELFHVSLEAFIQGEAFAYKEQKWITRIFIGLLMSGIVYIIYLIIQRSIPSVLIISIMLLMSGTIVATFGYALRNHDVTMIAGFNEAVPYYREGVEHILLAIQKRIVMGAAAVFILDVIIGELFHQRIVLFVGFIIFIVNVVASILICNWKYASQLYQRKEDFVKSRRAVPYMAICFLFMIATVVIAVLIAQIHSLHNNTSSATILGVCCIVCILTSLLYLFYTDYLIQRERLIKKGWTLGLFLIHLCIWGYLIWYPW